MASVTISFHSLKTNAATKRRENKINDLSFGKFNQFSVWQLIISGTKQNLSQQKKEIELFSSESNRPEKEFENNGIHRAEAGAYLPE